MCGHFQQSECIPPALYPGAQRHVDVRFLGSSGIGGEEMLLYCISRNHVREITSFELPQSVLIPKYMKPKKKITWIVDSPQGPKYNTK